MQFGMVAEEKGRVLMALPFLIFLLPFLNNDGDFLKIYAGLLP